MGHYQGLCCRRAGGGGDSGLILTTENTKSTKNTMEKHIKQIEALVAENEAIKERTPWLEVSRGGLLTAAANAKEHVAALKLTAKVEADPSKN